MKDTALYLQAPLGLEQNNSQVERLIDLLKDPCVDAFLCHNIHLIEHLIMKDPTLSDETALVMNYAPDIDIASVQNSLSGYHLFQGDPKVIKQLKKDNKDHYIGVGPIGTKHEAMQVGEAGADYIAFPSTEIELISWWVEHFEIPCIAWGCTSLSHAEELVKTKVEFIMPSPQLWRQDNGIEGIAAFLKQ